MLHWLVYPHNNQISVVIEPGASLGRHIPDPWSFFFCSTLLSTTVHRAVLFCLYSIAAIDRFDIVTCLEIERAYHGLAGVAKLSAAPCYVRRRFTNLRVRILFTAYIGLASQGRMRNIENEAVFVPAHFNGCLVNRVPVLWLWRRYVKIGAFKDNERFSRFRGCTSLRRCHGTYAGGEKLGFVHDFAPFELL